MKKEIRNEINATLVLVVISALLLACSPTIKLEAATDKPIEINLNIKIEQEILVKLDKDLDALFTKESSLFGK